MALNMGKFPHNSDDQLIKILDAHSVAKISRKCCDINHVS